MMSAEPRRRVDRELASALQKEQQRAYELAALYQLALDVMSQANTSITDTANAVLRNMLTLLNCKDAALLLIDDRNGFLMPVRSCSQSAPDDTNWPPNEFCERVFGNARALAWADPNDGSYLGVPLAYKEARLGVLIAYRPPFREIFGDEEIQLVTLIGSLCATVLTTVNLQRSLSDRLSVAQTVMDASPSGLLLLERGRVVMANPNALFMLGLDPLDYDYPLRLDGPDGLFSERVWEALDEVPPRFDYRLVGASGSRTRRLTVEVVSVKVETVLLQINDVTLLREIEAKRSKAVKETSHELKTPLTVMNLGLSNLLSYYESLPDEERRLMIGDVLEQVNEMQQLIAWTLDSKPEARRAKSTLAPLQAPTQVIARLIEEMRPLAAVGNIALTWNAEGDIPLPIAEQDLKTLARNLLSNAVKYTPDGGAVAAYAEIDGRWFVFTVADTGVGIPADETQRIFEPSYRASTRGEVEGTGIGLALVNEIVVRCGGNIQVESEVGRGSAFMVRIPQARF